MRNLSAKTVANIKRGIALLDAKGPADWRERIIPENLQLGSYDQCVLGQIYGDYWRGSSALNIRGIEDHFGFCLPERAWAASRRCAPARACGCRSCAEISISLSTEQEYHQLENGWRKRLAA